MTRTDGAQGWEQRRTEFLNHPEHGTLFFQSLYRKIAACIAPGRRSWEEISATDRFQQAFQFVVDRLLNVDGFRNVTLKHRESDSPLSFEAFIENRVNLVLTEWRSKRRNEPGVNIASDEHIQHQGSDVPPRATEGSSLSFEALLKRIEQLRQPYLASLLLWIWPLTSFPDSWRRQFEPAILDAGEKNGLSRAEVQRRLNEVMTRSGPASDDSFLEAEARLGMHFQKARFFDRSKRNIFGVLQRLGELGDYSPESGVQQELRCDCYQAVNHKAQKDALALFPADEIYEQLPSGKRCLINRPLWYRRRFAFCCYKQKYHRRVWLNTSLELLVQKPVDGPMAYPDISWILNCPQKTTGANLFRARKALFGQVNSEEADTDLAKYARSDVGETRAEWQAELDSDRLNACVCEDLKPEVVGISGKPGS